MNRYVAAFTNRRMLTTLLLGFSGGLPLALTGRTLQAWLTDSKLDIGTIGLFALVGLPYAMKFLWAPLMDFKALPVLGLRRGWMVVCQLGLFCATVALGCVDPTRSLDVFSGLAFLLAFFSASQDIVIDAYRTEIVDTDEELGAGAGTYITGYRIAMVAGGFALGLADFMSWRSVYLIMAGVNLIGLVTILLSPEPKVTRKRGVVSFSESVLTPFLEFFQRAGAMEILLFIMIYKISTLMATALTTTFLLELGYTKAMIGPISTGAGLVATISGTLAGGALMVKLGIKRSLWIFGVLQAMAGLSFCALSRWGGSHAQGYFALVAVISLDNFMMGLGTAALTGFMMKFASKKFTATQYALLTSVMAVSRVILIAHAGTLVHLVGWNWFFISTVPLCIPGLLLLNRFDHWETLSTKPLHTRIPRLDLIMIAAFVLALIGLSSDPLWHWLGRKDTGNHFVLGGAIGVLLVVAVGLLRPYFSADSGSHWRRGRAAH